MPTPEKSKEPRHDRPPMPVIQNVEATPFSSNNQVINHEPGKFLLDFQSCYPRFTPDMTPTLVIDHRVIILDPHIAKALHRALGENLGKYETRFGTIKTAHPPPPPAEPASTATQRPSYTG